MATYLYILVSLVMLGASAYFMVRSKRNAEYEVITSRLAGVTVYQHQAGGMPWWQVLFERAGIKVDKNKLAVMLVSVCAIFLLISLLVNVVVAIIVLVFFLTAAYVALLVIFHKRQEKIINQLPRFLDQVVRSMHTGKTLGDAVFGAIESVEDPLQEILLRIKRNVSLGVSFPDAFQEVADAYDMRELQVLALGVRVNFRFGGSMSDLLNNIIAFIRERERVSRQLHAMTGETRVSAAVLAVVPVGIAGYILLQNPRYIMTMWEDPSGRNWIIMALVLQVTGIIIMWRMLKSI